MKTFDRKDVYSWSNAEDAKQYIGKYCYFADSLRYLKDSVNKDINYLLKEVFNNEKDQVQGVFRDVDGDFWGLCLPAEKVIEVEEPKKYRKFNSTDEFLKFYKVGQVVHLKNKNNNLEQLTSIVSVFINCYCCVCLAINNGALPFEDLFKKYEIEINGKWQPFGVEE